MLRKLCLIFFIGITFSSCQKLLDYYNYNDETEPMACKIIKITNAGGGTVELNFYYNSAGLPDSVTKGPYGEYPFSTLFPYEYDELGRLIRTGAYTTESPSKVTYAYEGSLLNPARDTIHSF